jgi:hypothetical protein
VEFESAKASAVTDEENKSKTVNKTPNTRNFVLTKFNSLYHSPKLIAGIPELDPFSLSIMQTNWFLRNFFSVHGVVLCRRAETLFREMLMVCWSFSLWIRVIPFLSFVIVFVLVVMRQALQQTSCVSAVETRVWKTTFLDRCLIATRRKLPFTKVTPKNVALAGI